MTRAFWTVFLCLTWTVNIFAQQPQPPQETETPPAAAIEIADEPVSISPSTLLPAPLTKSYKADFDETSLTDVIQWLEQEAKLTVLVDQRSLDEAGILPNELVSERLQDEPLYLMLDRLRSLSIAWRYQDSKLHLESVDAEKTYTAQYNVGNLFDAGHDPDTLLDTITSTVAPDSWDEVGGPGSIMLLGDVLFVRQSNRGHRHVKGLLAALKQHGRRTLVDDPESHAKIRATLGKSITVSFRNMPLMNVVKELAETTGIDIRLDLAALNDALIRPRVSVNLSLDEQPLTVALDVLASQYELAWTLRDGAIWVTTGDAEAMVVAVYDVRDLCRDSGESMGLSDAITSQASPDSWEEVGGAGVISFPVPGSMVMYHTERMHDDVLDLLENYRSALRVSKRRVREEQDPDAVLVRYYRMQTDVAADLETAIPELLSVDSWKSEAHPDAIGTILRLSSTTEIQRDNKTGEVIAQIPHAVLVIRQTRKVHDALPNLLIRVNNGDLYGGFGGGMGGMGGGMGGGFGGGGMGGSFGGGFFSIPERNAK